MSVEIGKKRRKEQDNMCSYYEAQLYNMLRSPVKRFKNVLITRKQMQVVSEICSNELAKKEELCSKQIFFFNIQVNDLILMPSPVNTNLLAF